MNHQKNIDQYLEGWRIGDPSLSYSVTGEKFTYDDPNTGIIQKSEFIEFFEDFKQGVAELKGEAITSPFLNYYDTIIDRSGPIWTVWCWWHAAGSDFQGCALIKVGGEGILSEKISYYTRLP